MNRSTIFDGVQESLRVLDIKGETA